MPFRSVADPEQVEFLSVVLNDYCTAHHISPGTQEHGEIARRIMYLFSIGHAVTDLPDALSTFKSTDRSAN